MENGIFATTLPSGIGLEISIPKESIGVAIAKWPDRESLISVGDVIDFSSANGTCVAGCNVTFTFSTGDAPFGINLLNSCATAGGVIVSFSPHINNVGTLILTISWAILFR